MMNALKKFTFFFAIQFLNYGLLCWNFRSIAQGWYLNIAVSDFLIAGLTFKVIKRIAEEEHGAALWGYILGGVTGSLTSVWITKHLLG